MAAIANNTIAPCAATLAARRRANTAPCILLTTFLVSDDLLLLLAQALHAERHDVACLEVLRFRLHPHGDARGRAGRDNVARQQRHILGNVRDEFGDAENHRLGIAGLSKYAVDL